MSEAMGADSGGGLAAVGEDGAGSAIGVGALSVSELHRLLDEGLRSAGIDRVWVSGTVAGLRRGAKFWTFELADYADGTTARAVISVGAFATEARRMVGTLAAAGVELTDGLAVTIGGRIDLNPRYGRLRILAERVDPRTSVGAVVLARDELVAELAAAGLLEAQAALVVPDVVGCLGLISSATGAARADVIGLLDRSPTPLRVIEAHAAMSGPGAGGEVAAAIEALTAAGVELVLIARGGGARTDLSAWDSAGVATAIARCPIPVWTALGHATDHSIADRVAKATYATPSAAAEALVARSQALVVAAQVLQREQEHGRQLAATKRRAAYALVVALVVVLVAIAMVMAR